MRGKWRAQRADRGAHAARGFVGGAAALAAEKFFFNIRFNAARGFVGGAADDCGRCPAHLRRFNAARGYSALVNKNWTQKPKN